MEQKKNTDTRKTVRTVTSNDFITAMGTVGKKELLNNSFFPIYFHCLYLSTTYKQYALQVLYPEYNLLSFLFDVSPAIL